MSEYRRSTYAVWELTLACNLACCHCGSRAGKARPDELSTEEALDVVRQLAEVGIEEVTLIGGEAFLRADWLTIAAAIVEAGMYCTLTTGGFGIGPKTAERMVRAGIHQTSVSIDGLEATHDRLRGRQGSWKACFESLKNLRAAGMPVTCNSQINRLSAGELMPLYQLLHEAGIRAWQWSMTVPMGNAADHPEILLQPVELLDVFPELARIKQRMDADGVMLHAGNNVGYYGPYHRLLFSEGEIWAGCHAGLNGLGMEADGTVKGCPSLPSSPYTGGNVRQRSLKAILETAPELAINLGAPTDHLWGYCRECQYADLCRGGCTWTAHVFFDRPGNNPYCHHRALALAARGQRERLVRVEKAPGVPFDNGRFDLVVEDLGAPWPQGDERLLLPRE